MCRWQMWRVSWTEVLLLVTNECASSKVLDLKLVITGEVVDRPACAQRYVIANTRSFGSSKAIGGK